MGVNILEFCTPPVPGQTHKYYGNGHNNFIKLPVTVLPNNSPKATTTVTNPAIPPNASLHSLATGGNLTLMKHILPLLPAEAVDEPHPATGLTPLHFAASRGHFEMVKYLVDECGATIDAKDKEGEVKHLNFLLLPISLLIHNKI
jgi:ankyrin repeat protein